MSTLRGNNVEKQVCFFKCLVSWFGTMTKTVKSKLLPIAEKNNNCNLVVFDSRSQINFSFQSALSSSSPSFKKIYSKFMSLFFVSKVPLTAAAAETELEKLRQSIFQFAKQ